MIIIVILLLMLNKIRSSSLNIASILTEDLGSAYGVYIQELILTMRSCSKYVVIYAPESLE